MKSLSLSSSSSTSSSAESLSMDLSDSFSSPSQAHGDARPQQPMSPVSRASTDSDLQQQQQNQSAAPASHAQATAPSVVPSTTNDDGDCEPYERNFWANIFSENSMVDSLLGDETMEDHDDDNVAADTEMKHSPNAHPASHLESGALDATPSSALLDHWSNYDDSMANSIADFSVPMTSASSSSSLFPHSLLYHQPQHPLTGTHGHDGFLASMKPSAAAYSPHEPRFTPLVAPRRVSFETRSDGTPFALSKPILRDDGTLLVGTELADSSMRDRNRIFVTNVNSSNPGRNAANILVDSEVRDLHWMNHQTAIVAIGNDIHLISIGALSGNRSCHLQSAIPSVHSDAIRELAVQALSYRVLSGGFDETVVLTDLRRGGDPTASAIVSKFDAHDVVSSLRWSPDESHMSWTTDGGDFQVGDARIKTPQLKVPLYTYLQVDTMGGLFTHEYLSAHKVVLGFERNHLVYLDTRMARNSCCYAVSKSPMATTGEIRRSKANKFTLFGLGGFTSADLLVNAKSQEVLKLRQYNQSPSAAYKTSGDFSFESNSMLAVSDNMGAVTLYSGDASARVADAALRGNWKDERAV